MYNVFKVITISGSGSTSTLLKTTNVHIEKIGTPSCRRTLNGEKRKVYNIDELLMQKFGMNQFWFISFKFHNSNLFICFVFVLKESLSC